MQGRRKDKGSFFEEIWFSSDKKEWNGKEWIPTNPDADPQISGYHITQEFSSFVTPEQLEYKRKNMTPRMFTNEVLAQFFAAGGSKPVTTETLLQILVRSPGRLNNSVFEEKVIGVDWGDETRWVLVGRTAKNKFYVIDTGVFDDIDTMKHVEKLKTDNLTGKPEMDNMRCWIWQDQEPDIDEVLSWQGVECVYEFGFKYSHLEYDQ